MMPPARIAIMMLMVVLIAIFGITTVNNMGNSPEGPTASTDVEYLTKIKASELGSVIEVDGSASLNLIGIDRYVCFDDLGEATVKLSSGKTLRYNVVPANLKLILLTGQSNSMFYTAPKYWTDPNPIKPGSCFYFGTEADPSLTVGGNATPETVAQSEIRDLVDDTNKPQLAQMYPIMCSDLVKESGDRFLIISGGLGGRAISNWNPGNICDGWTKNLIIFVKQACEGKINLDPTCVLWVQGEGDKNNSEEYYYEKFTELCEKFRNGYFGFAFPAVFFSVPTTATASYDSMTNPAKAQIAASEAYDWIVKASTLSYRFERPGDFRDGVHYTQRAYNWIGEAFARAVSIYEGWETVEQTIVILDAIEGQPITVTGYGTTGDAYTCTIRWADNIGTVSAPPGMRIAADISEIVQEIPDPEEPEPEPEEP